MQRITLTDEMRNALLNKFTNYINTTKIDTNRFTFSTDLAEYIQLEDVDRPTLYIESEAFLKMQLYVQQTSTEIAWHGTVTKTDKDYIIHDVFLYPQKIAAATVQTDQDKYNAWTEELDDETFNSMRFQGHSHVNMGVSPSGVDTSYYNDMLQVLSKNDFYIFMILNKSGDMHLLIYDLAKNIVYNKNDIDVKIIATGTTDLMAYISKEKANYCVAPTYNYTNYQEYTKYNSNRSYPTLTEMQRKFTTAEDYMRDLPPTSDLKVIEDEEDVNDLLDEIDKKYKNAKLIFKKKGDK